MSSTRERALAAAVAEVGENGIRALTHARVDMRAGLPRGSTSNWFRSREALVAGLIVHIAESERTDPTVDPRVRITDAEGLIDALSAAVEAQTTTHAERTRVRLALSLDAAHDPVALEPLLAQRRAFVEWAENLLAAVGATHPSDAARTLLACGNGLVFHRLTMDPDAEIRPVIARAVHACLT